MNCREPLREKITLYSGRQSAGDRARTHGMSNTAIYAIWDSMIQRCYNQNRRDFKTYGAKGVTVCERWRTSFVNFFDDMGHRPKGMTLDRIDTSKGYSPENCRWASTLDQARNRTDNKMIPYGGKTQCLKDWAIELGINHITLQDRLAKGWSVDRAFMQPVAKMYSHQKNRKTKTEVEA